MTSPSGLWAEGDSLSPTNLNRRNPVGTFPAKIYHVAWAAGTGTTQINNAITNALAGGYNAVFIDASRLPYDPSLVSFNNAIHMLREGGALTLDEWDVEAYGANPGQIADVGIQAAIDAAAATPSSGVPRVVRLRSQYFVTKPIIVRGSDITLRGPGTGNFGAGSGALLTGAMAGGPVLLLSGTAVVLGLGTALVSGSGNSYNTQSPAQHLFNLSYLDTIELDGLSQLCVECYIKTSPGLVSKAILSSNGRLLANAVSGFSNECFALLIDFAGRLQGQLQANTFPTINSGAVLVNDGAVHHVAMTYDSSTLRLFVDGTLVGSTALTGTIQQQFFEQVAIGPIVDRVPEMGTIVDSGIDIDAVRIRNLGTYTSNFTPSFAKWGVADANTLAQCNFDDSHGPCIKVTNKNGTAWIPQSIGTGGGGATEVGLEGVNIGTLVAGRCMGVYLYGQTYHWHMKEGSIRNCRAAIYGGPGNHYTIKVDHVYITATKYGIALNSTSGGLFSGVWIEGAQCAFVFASGFMFNNVFIQVANTNGIHGGVIRQENNGGTPAIFNNVVINMETGVSAKWNGTLVLGGLGGLSQNGIVATACDFEAAAGKPWIIADALEGSQFNSCCFTLVSGSPSAVMTNSGLNALVRPVQFNNCSQLGTWRQWSDVSGTATVGKIGTLYSSSTGSTLNFDASVADEWDITLTSDVTQSAWSKINYGQPVSGAIKMDSTGSRLFTWPTNSKGTATLSYGSSAVNTFTGFYDGVNVILTSVRTGL